MATLDLRGQRFGKLTAIEPTGEKSKSGHNWIWLCRCECGNYKKVNTGNLRSGQTISCGCHRKERMGKLNLSHGGRQERLYLVWMDMRRRCRDEKDLEYHNYGGRGISVCREWESYENFRKWAKEQGYDESAAQGKCTLDRINVNGNYCPENCRFVDMKVQNNNRRNNLLLEYRGRVQTAAQWERELGFGKGVVASRIRRGWSVEKALESVKE